MIIVTCKNFSFVRDRIIYSFGNNYITSIEYIDNEFNETIVKESDKLSISFTNLKGRYHNPIGPAYQSLYKDGSLKFEEYFINNKRVPKIKGNNKNK